jgi:hypothetical protein
METGASLPTTQLLPLSAARLRREPARELLLPRVIMAKTTTKTEPTPAVEPTPAERLHTLRSILNHKIESSRTIIASFAKDLADSSRLPLEVLSWSARAFEAAATLQVGLEISQRVDTGESIVDIHTNLMREALRGARSGASSSTSPASNYATACRISALAEFEELLRYDALKTKVEMKADPTK